MTRSKEFVKIDKVIRNDPVLSELYDDLQKTILQFPRFSDKDLIAMLFELTQKDAIKVWFLRDDYIGKFLNDLDVTKMPNTQDFLQYGHILSNRDVASEVQKERIDQYLQRLDDKKFVRSVEVKSAEKLKIKFKQIQ
jgi:uncharacterized protein YlbG (UPF0298 family)